MWGRLRAATAPVAGRTVSSGPPAVVCGKIVSGSKVLASAKGDTRAFLRHNYSDAVAVEMEGHGFLYSANETSCPALLVRGISDNVDDKSKRDAEGWQPVAAARAAAFAFHVLSRFDPSLLK